MLSTKLNNHRSSLHCGRATTANRLASISATHSDQSPQQFIQLAESSSKNVTVPPEVAGSVAVVAGLSVAAFGLSRWLDAGSRPYSGNVGQEYDAWTTDGILERLWGEHIHLGYYTAEQRAAGYLKTDFKQAKYVFSDEMLHFSGSTSPNSVLDVGCGFGGTSRHLARKFPGAKVEGITLSPKQVERGTQLAKEQGLGNVGFKVMDALKMEYPDNSFDLVWACESGEHMPDKKKYVEEMVRVLKPGGTLVIACWCQREETPENPLTDKDKRDLQFLYDEWAHPFFISIEEFVRLMRGTGKMGDVVAEDWTPQTLPSWHHSIWAGVFDPWIVFSQPHTWYRTARDGLGILRMHDGFERGLMTYGLMAGKKVGGAVSTLPESAKDKVGVKVRQA